MTIDKEQPVSDAALKAGVKALKRNFLVQPHDYTVAQIYLAMKAASHPLEQQQAVSGDVVERIGRLLAGDPICGGRVSSDTVEAIAALTSSGVGRMRELEAFAKAVPSGSDNELCPWCLSCDHWAGCVELCPAPSSRAVTKALIG